jgi:subtilisin-like proprotein convertase family protein
MKDTFVSRFPRLAVFVIFALLLAAFQNTGAFFLTATQSAKAAAAIPYHAAEPIAPEEGIVNVFPNTSPIIIPEGGAASPYPSTINVSGIPIQAAKVTVRINSLTHTFPSDIDIMLVGPQGQTAVIMSDVGSGTAVGGIFLTLDDAAAAVLPTAAPLTSGTFKPTNAGTGDAFPAPAPANDGSSALSVFNGTNPNGEWRLFVFDDVGLDSGTISMGWTLNITAAISGQNTNAITIPDNGIASPYPSEINITGHPDPVSRILVTLTNFSHASPDDVDIMLVSPSGRSAVLMSDAGGANAASNLNITFDDLAAGSLPDAGALTSGSFRPTDFEPGETFPGPAPSGGPIGRTLSSFNGSVANGTWKLFVVDDSGNNVGNITGGWNILIGTTAGGINITGTGAADPYPSEISISGRPGSITNATVTLSNFSHLSPDDVDILLVGPDGRRIVLMSDAGGQMEVGGLNLVFDDSAPPLPDSGPITSGSYRPSDYEPGEVFPAPAPSGPTTGTTLNAFYGGVPNGIWKLYVVNENGTNYGSITGSWNITLQTSTSACLVTISPGVQAFPVAGGAGGFNVNQPSGCAWTASTIDSFLTITSPVAGGGNGTITFNVAPNQGPARTGTIDVSNGVATRSFLVQQPSGCPLSIGQSTLNFRAAGGTGNVTVQAGGACSWTGSTFAGWIQITSQPQSGSGTLVFNVQPNPTHAARSAIINIGSATVNVNQAPSRATAFDFDGDSKSDVSVFRPSTGTWWISRSTGGVTAQEFGIAGDQLAPADFDGDLKADIGVFRNGVWYVVRSSTSTIEINSWGSAGDLPVPADYNSDGKAELAVFRSSSGTWWILNPNGTYSSTAFGTVGDLPTPGDYDGDGKTDISVYRSGAAAGVQGTWWILNSSDGNATPFPFGVQGDVPVQADYDGDGRDNIALYRPSTGVWYRSTNAATNYDAVQWGVSTDRPVPADYDGDGRSEPAVMRFGDTMVWYILGSTSGVQISQFGSAGDTPVPGAYVP